MSWTEAPATTASMATTNTTDGRKESSKSISRSLRVEFKGVGVRVDWLLQLLSDFTQCWPFHWERLQSKRYGFVKVT